MKKLLNFRYPFYSFLALLFGCNIAKSLYAGIIESVFIVCACFVFVIVLSVIYKKVLPLCLIVIFFFAGHGWFFLGQSLFEVKDYQGQNLIVGRVCDSSFLQTDSYSNIILENVTINGEKASNVCVYIFGESSSISVGDNLSFEGELEKEKCFNLGVFNLSAYRNGVRYTTSINSSSVIVVKGQKQVDEAFRANVKNALLESMSEENAYLAYAVLFGDKTMIDDNIYETYRVSGILHLLTVSGLHVSFLAGAIFFILKLLKTNKYINIAVVSILLLCYCYICAFSPSVVRASIMAVVLCLSSILKRPYDNLNALAIAGFLIVLFSPLSSIDVGFLMSFCSVLCIFLLANPLSRLLSKFLPKSVSTVMAVSISAQIGILPFISSFFSTFNFLSVFANLLIIPFFSLVFPFLFLFAVFASFMPFISSVFVVFDFCFKVINSIATFFAFSSLTINLKPFSISMSMFFLLLVFSLSDFLVVNSLSRLLISSILCLCLVGSVVFPVILQKNFFSIVFAESYSGQTIVLTSSNGDCLYYGDDYHYQRLSSINNNFEIDFYLCEELSVFDKQVWKENGADLFITSKVSSSELDEIVLTENSVQVGDFEISFIENCFIVNFDGKSVLIVSENFSQENLNALLNIQKYDIIYLGDFVLQTDYVFDCVVVCNQKQKFSSYDLESYGNFLVYLESLNVWRLD